MKSLSFLSSVSDGALEDTPFTMSPDFTKSLKPTSTKNSDTRSTSSSLVRKSLALISILIEPSQKPAKMKYEGKLKVLILPYPSSYTIGCHLMPVFSRLNDSGTEVEPPCLTSIAG